MKILEAVGYGREGAGKDGINVAGPGIDVLGGGAVGALVRQRGLGGDGGDAQGPGLIPSPGGQADHRDDGDMWGGRGVGIPPGGGRNGIRGTSPHRRVYQETTDDYSGKVGLPPHI